MVLGLVISGLMLFVYGAAVFGLLGEQEGPEPMTDEQRKLDRYGDDFGI